MQNTYKILVRIPEGKVMLGRQSYNRKIKIKRIPKEIRIDNVRIGCPGMPL
jgi:hypothetical protein